MSKRYIFSILWVIVSTIISYYIIYENVINVKYEELQAITRQQEIREILVDSDNSYFYAKNGHIYKIATQSLFNQVPITIKQTHTNTTKSYYGLGLYFITPPTISSKLSLTTKIVYAGLVILVGLLLFIICYPETEEEDKDEEVAHAISHSIKLDEHERNDMSVHLEPMQSSVRFSDVAGINEAKDDLLEIIDYLKNPKKYQDLGIYLPKGVLLIGPPGVGKTMIAKAIAGEAGVPFFYQSGSSFVQMYVGVGAQRVRDLFAKARINAPAIIFIDEIDAIGKIRNGENHEWESTLNELLTQMDGFGDQSGIIVIAATNQVDVIDSALLRSGRFDRRIYVDLPDLTEREEILRVHLLKRSHKLDLHEVAKLCMGFSGANISSLINEAAINALRHNRQEILMQDISETIDKVMFGRKRQNTLTNKQKQIMAVYNAGKAISQYWFLQDFQKITLMQTSFTPKIDEYSSKSELISHIKIALSGNLALEVNGLESSTIALQDLNTAKYIAHKMCLEYGMAQRLIANEDDVIEILENAINEHKEFMESNKNNIQQLASILLEREKLHKDEIHQILNII